MILTLESGDGGGGGGNSQSYSGRQEGMIA